MIFGKYINRYYLRHAPTLLLGIAALILVDYMQLIIPELYRMLINGVNSGQVLVGGVPTAFDKTVLMQNICLPMIGIIVSMVIGRFLWRICFFGAAIRVETELRNRMFDHSKDLSQSYYQVNKVGNLMSLYTNDLETIQECFGDGVLMFCDALFLGLLAFIKMWRMDASLTMMAMIPAFLMFLVGSIVGRVMTRRWEERQQAFADLSDFAQENFSGIAVVKAFVKETKELMAFRKLNRENEEINVIYTRISTLLNILVTLFVESVTCVILGYGGYLVYTGRFNAGQLVEYIGYFSAIVWPIMAVSMLIEKTSRGKASLNRITELLDAPVDVADRPGVHDLTGAKGEIEFRHLTFRYPDGEFDVLKDVSFTIHSGERVGIVGKTGAGKTALVDLILRGREHPVHPVGALGLRLCAAGQLPVLGHHLPQHFLRRGRSGAGRHRARGPAGRRPRQCGRLQGRLQYRAGRARRHRLGRPEAAHLHRPRPADGRAGPDFGRLGLGGGHPHREGHSGQPQPGARGQDHHPDRPPHFDGGTDGQDHFHRRRADRGRGRPRRFVCAL